MGAPTRCGGRTEKLRRWSRSVASREGMHYIWKSDRQDGLVELGTIKSRDLVVFLLKMKAVQIFGNL